MDSKNGRKKSEPESSISCTWFISSIVTIKLDATASKSSMSFGNIESREVLMLTPETNGTESFAVAPGESAPTYDT